MQLKGVEQSQIDEREKSRESEKNKRINRIIQLNQQSKMIEQRKRNLPSTINFESNEDSLDGFDFSEFNPR